MSKRTTITTAFLGLIALITSACGNGATQDTTTNTTDEETTTTSATTTTSEEMTTTTTVDTTTTTEGTTTTTASAVGDFTEGIFQTEGFPVSGEPKFLTAVDVESQEGFDRVVFQLDGDLSNLSYKIEPVTESEFNTPDGELDVDGSEYVQISISPASGVDLSGESPVETYLGPDSFVPQADTGTIAELAISEDFEGQMSWVVGLEQSPSYAHELNVEEGELIVDFSTS